MNTIAKSQINEAWNVALAASPQQARTWMEDLMRHEPFVEAYLFTADEHFAPSEKRGLIFLLGFLIWKTLSDQHHAPKRVSYQQLVAAQQENIRLMYELAEDMGADFLDAASKMIESHNQIPMLEMVRDTLASVHSSAVPVDANLRLALVHLKTVTDCLDR
jgi:hypothetical protein